MAVLMQNLRQVRQEYPMTIRQLSASSGVSTTTISNLENMRRMARPQTVRKLAEALEVDPEALSGGDTAESRRSASPERG